TVIGRARLNESIVALSRVSRSCGKNSVRLVRTNFRAPITLTGRPTKSPVLPARSWGATATVYRPSGAVAPPLTLPFQVMASATLPLGTVQVLTTLPPASVTRVTSAPVSAFVAARLTVSRTPSLLGENHRFGSASGERSSRSGALVSTTSFRDALAAPLSQASSPVTLTEYVPSTTGCPETSPFQAPVKVEPVPVVS